MNIYMNNNKFKFDITASIVGTYKEYRNDQ